MARPSVITGALKEPFAEQLAFWRNKLGELIPTARWDDVWQAGHDKGFMVAGAAKADLLQDLAMAVDRAIAEGKGLEAFRRDFRAIVERRGWHGWTGEGTAAGERWRTRIIYWGNTASSYAAGRRAQLEEYPLWVYHHSDLVEEPRLQHLAWDGLTLPADHVFWQTHYPPGGWGCECWVSGARDADTARRVGGDPDKRLPDGWDAIDPKTGAPRGIDRGWNYMPGDTVADTVRTMAAKTQQWDYTLAKAYMQSIPQPHRDAMAEAYRALPSVARDTRLYAQRILEGRTELDIPPYRTLGLLTSQDAAQVQRVTGADVAGFDWALDASAVRHIRGEHGDAAREAGRGQLAVEASDYSRLPEMLSSPDGVESAASSWRTGHPLVRITKTIGGKTYVGVWEVRAKRKMLALDSLYIRKGQ